MLSVGSSDEDYAARRLRRLQQDLNQGTFVDWGTEEAIAARREELEHNVRAEVRRIAPTRSTRPGTRISMGSINPQHVFSHRMQGTVPPTQDLGVSPLI